ncbi:hypothetical protein VNO78_08071 [Psophocarpus tetragonolobus]|uniref:Uncharacterized protein n=1 Tax=Psophocarpus tetragonolobus TaxID=3891 RepID=A0AAN9SX73_PSOTE
MSFALARLEHAIVAAQWQGYTWQLSRPGWTNSIVKGLVYAGVGQVISLVEELLAYVVAVPVPIQDQFDTAKAQFTSRVRSKDRKLLQSIGMKKWNLMMIGDGMDATIISGNWNVTDD